jgi:hypothetical protein
MNWFYFETNQSTVPLHVEVTASQPLNGGNVTKPLTNTLYVLQTSCLGE